MGLAHGRSDWSRAEAAWGSDPPMGPPGTGGDLPRGRSSQLALSPAPPPLPSPLRPGAPDPQLWALQDHPRGSLCLRPPKGHSPKLPPAPLPPPPGVFPARTWPPTLQLLDRTQVPFRHHQGSACPLPPARLALAHHPAGSVPPANRPALGRPPRAASRPGHSCVTRGLRTVPSPLVPDHCQPGSAWRQCQSPWWAPWVSGPLVASGSV